MKQDVDWLYVKEFYKQHFGIDGWVVELFANMDILQLCLSGVSNTHIEEFLELPSDEIKTVLQSTFDFEGWEQDLPINPYKVFLDVGENDFAGEVSLQLVPYIEFHDLNLLGLLNMCKTMKDIEGKINDEWI